MNAPLGVAGALALLATVVHGLGGEILVVRKLSPEVLSPSPFGGPRMTRAMIHVTWHLTTVAFFSVGVALVFAGAAREDGVARGAGVFAAGTSTGFVAVMAGLGAANVRSPRLLLRHPAP